jgi:hypothetical protein
MYKKQTEKRFLKMVYVNFYVVHGGGARASILMTLLMMRVPAPANTRPQGRVVYDEFVDYGHEQAGTDGFYNCYHYLSVRKVIQS